MLWGVVGALLGLVLRALVLRAYRCEWSPGRRAIAFAAGILGFAAAAVGVNVAGMQGGSAERALALYLANAVWWDFASNATVGALLVVAFAYLETDRRLQAQRALVERAEALRVRAELQALRARLDPHFLFNTLHSITALVRQDPRGAETALEQFSALMRYVLDAGSGRGDEVALEEELTFVRQYLALERVRLGDRLRVVEEIDEEALECAIPAVTLQPLVENALRHGIAPRTAAGTVRLAARVVGDQLVLEVADDGVGGNPARAMDGSGVGLGVVRERLLARHGGAVDVQVTAAAGEGWRVRLTLPAVALRFTSEHATSP
jgi:LytS/YehU family sensor histidine kinase